MKLPASTFNEENSANSDEWQTLREQVFHLARQIPRGRVMSYGALGALCDPPISGYICGRAIGSTPADVPWWRVVAKTGALPISKRNPQLAVQQREQLQAEGVTFDDDNCVTTTAFVEKLREK